VVFRHVYFVYPLPSLFFKHAFAFDGYEPVDCEQPESPNVSSLTVPPSAVQLPMMYRPGSVVSRQVFVSNAPLSTAPAVQAASV
jgi:hypothetical protein